MQCIKAGQEITKLLVSLSRPELRGRPHGGGKLSCHHQRRGDRASISRKDAKKLLIYIHAPVRSSVQPKGGRTDTDLCIDELSEGRRRNHIPILLRKLEFFPIPARKPAVFVNMKERAPICSNHGFPLATAVRFCVFIKKKKTAFEYLPCRCIQNKLTPANPFSQALAHTVGLGLRMQANI